VLSFWKGINHQAGAHDKIIQSKMYLPQPRLVTLIRCSFEYLLTASVEKTLRMLQTKLSNSG